MELETTAIKTSHKRLTNGVPAVLEVPNISFVVTRVLRRERSNGGRAVTETCKERSDERAMSMENYGISF